MPVILDPHRGEALLAGRKVPLLVAGNKGELQIFGSDGPVLHPLTFGERMRAVRQACATTQPQDVLAASILHAATIAPGAGDYLVLEIIALKLAGGGLFAPPLHECVTLVTQATGWTPAQLYEAEAVEVDQLAAQLDRQMNHSEWNQLLIFNHAEEDLHAIRASLADSLLRRAEGDPGESNLSQEQASPQSGSIHPGYDWLAQKSWEKQNHLRGNHAAAYQPPSFQNEEGENTFVTAQAQINPVHSASALQPSGYARFPSRNDTPAKPAGHAIFAEESRANTPAAQQFMEQALEATRHSARLDPGLHRDFSSLMPLRSAKMLAPNFDRHAAIAPHHVIKENEASFFIPENMPRIHQEKLEDAASTSPRFTEPSFRMAPEEAFTEWAETLAVWLHTEADLRGVER